ncbi:hypothetical protein ES705_26606 [subsurface metagenome]
MPAHIWVRLSAKEPRIHKQPSLRRGVQFAEDVRFCFTVFEDNEQYEDGDTFVHTFYKQSWPFCTTKWFYFWGSIAGEVCISTSAIFKYHNDGISPVPVPEVLRTYNSIEPNLISMGTANIWRDVDLSYMVSPDAKGVLLHCRNLAPTTWSYWDTRKPLAGGNFRVTARPPDAFWAIVGLDDNLKFEIRTSVNDIIEFWLMGYFNKNLVFLDSCPDRSPAYDDAWHVIDWSDIAPTAQAGIFLVGGRSSATYDYGVRPYGSTQDFREWGFGTYAIVKLDAGRMEAYIDHHFTAGSCALVMVGYVAKNGLFHVNSPLINPVGTWSWETHTISGLHDHPTLAILHWLGTTGAPSHGERKYLGDHCWVNTTLRHAFPYAHPDYARKFDRLRANTSQNIYLHGTLD